MSSIGKNCFMVGDVGNAPTTSAMSMLHSTSELIALKLFFN